MGSTRMLPCLQTMRMAAATSLCTRRATSSSLPSCATCTGISDIALSILCACEATSSSLPPCATCPGSQGLMGKVLVL